MNKELPIRLGKKPLIDAVFEFRFSSELPASEIILGSLYNAMGEGVSIKRLPTAIIPPQMREHNPSLAFAPVSQLSFGGYYINIGDKSVSISPVSPEYQGWSDYKSTIVRIIRHVNDTNLITKIDRFSMKYTNMFQASIGSCPIHLLNLKLEIANRIVENEVFQLRLEVKKSAYINIIQVFSSAIIDTGTVDAKREGLILDIDTISQFKEATSMTDFMLKIEDNLDSIHNENKTQFFACLTKQTIDDMEPIYE